MKRLLAFLMMLLLAAGFSFEGLAADAFDAASASDFAVSAARENAESSDIVFGAEEEQVAPLILFTRSLRNAVEASLGRELRFPNVHGQPLPGVLITLLLGAAFGLARKMRGGRHSAQEVQNAADAGLIATRLLRMKILFLNPPETIHTISPGPDLFCLLE